MQLRITQALHATAHNAAKLNLYVALADDVLRGEDHNETIGIGTTIL
ncbi:hypothetical protein [Arthrobacter sp. ISL-30]|nr:hypothetical protein [Arthrobacter sp. ISL-30]MBT2515798.1 hypothetical protein [Arthrobacter sp. ISL-30]